MFIPDLIASPLRFVEFIDLITEPPSSPYLQAYITARGTKWRPTPFEGGYAAFQCFPWVILGALGAGSGTLPSEARAAVPPQITRGGFGSTGRALRTNAPSGAPDAVPAAGASGPVQTVRVFTVTSDPVGLGRPGTGLRTTEGRLTATGAGGTFVVEQDITVGATKGLEGLPPTRGPGGTRGGSVLEHHIEEFPTKGSEWNYVTEIELPTTSLKLDPTAPNPQATASRWVPPGAEGAKVVRYWKIRWVEDANRVERPILEGPFEGPPPAK